MKEYYNPKLRTYIAKNEKDLGQIEQGNLTFLKDGNAASAYMDVSDTMRIPVLPVWEEIDESAAPSGEYVSQEQLGELVEGVTEYEVELLFEPRPGTLNVYFDGFQDYFHDTQATIPQSGVSPLVSTPGYLGTATLHYLGEGQHPKIIINLDQAPVMSGLYIYASYYKRV